MFTIQVKAMVVITGGKKEHTKKLALSILDWAPSFNCFYALSFLTINLHNQHDDLIVFATC